MLYAQYLHISHHLQAMKMTFLEVFLNCMFKDPKLAEKWTNLAENLNKQLNLAEFMEFVFFKSDLDRYYVTPLKCTTGINIHAFSTEQMLQNKCTVNYIKGVTGPNKEENISDEK